MDKGDEYNCDICGGTHTVKIDEGFPALMGHEVTYVDCPEYGYMPV